MLHKKYSLQVGDSFTLRDQEGNHLNVIIAELSPGDDGAVILVYLATAEKN